MRNFIPTYNYRSNNYPIDNSLRAPFQYFANPYPPSNYSYPNNYENSNENNFEEMKSFYHKELEKNKKAIMDECQYIIVI